MSKLKNFLLNCLVRCVKFLRRKKLQVDHTRFLIVSTTGLGDTLWATPAIRALRLHYPAGYIAVLTSQTGAAVLKKNPHINEIFVIRRSPILSLPGLYRTLHSRAIHTALIFHVSQRPLIPFCHLIGAQQVIGTATLSKGCDQMLTRAIPHEEKHEILRRLDIVREVGAVPKGGQLEIFPEPEDQAIVTNFLNEWNILNKRTIIGIHPGAKDRFKQWDPACFITVGNRLAKEFGYQIIITGAADEEQLVKHIAENISGAIPVYGQFNIPQLAVLQSFMKLLITNDTGPMHLAAARAIPLLALFGPTSPHLCRPFGPLTQIIAAPPTCSPCLKKRCREPFCLLQITPEHVIQEALTLLFKT
jgi:ADP-heptose:LPS heptosyltransferase